MQLRQKNLKMENRDHRIIEISQWSNSEMCWKNQSSQENEKMIQLNKLHETIRSATLLKRGSKVFSCEICEIFKNIFFYSACKGKKFQRLNNGN